MANPGHRARAPQAHRVLSSLFGYQHANRHYFLLAICGAVFAADKPEWDNPAIVHVGTEKPHATMMVYPSAELARTGDRAKSPWFQLLNGTWKFHGSLRPADRPAGLLPPRLQRRRVGNDTRALQLADARLRYSDLHEHHLSVAAGPLQAAAGSVRIQPGRQLSHALHRPARLEGPPGLPPLRRRRFRLLRLGQRQELGYSEDSRTPAEFNLTPHLKAGRTCWPSRSTASATARSSKIRTCGA